MNLHARLTVALTLLLFSILASLLLALHLPQPRGLFSLDGEQIIYSAPTGQRHAVVALKAGEQQLPANPLWLIAEPDVLESFEEFNGLMDQQRLMSAASQRGDLVLITGSGEQLAVPFRQRQLGDLHWLFWFQIGVGSAILIIGGMVWSAKPGKATTLYAASGLFLAVATNTAAVYSTRSMFIDGDIFRFLSDFNSCGALLFSSSFSALLWHYPQQLGRFPVAPLSFIAGFASCAMVIFQWEPAPNFYYFLVLGIYAVGFIFAVLQWRFTRDKPLERAALLWFLIAIFTGTGGFASLQLVPAALGLELLVPQEILFAVFLLMYGGVALGLIRYRLFDLERWWFALWGWLLGGAAVIAVDLALVSLPAMGQTLALSLSLAMVGWLYFPVRQWFWKRFVRVPERNLERILQQSIPRFTAIRSVTELRSLWLELLQEVFQPLRSQPCVGVQQVQLLDGGQAMNIPDVLGEGNGMQLQLADRGRRLFSRDDLALVTLLQGQFEIAQNSLRASERGRMAERERIRRDIHDDLGARLLTLLHRSNEGERPLVREAIKDLRSLLEALDTEARPLEVLFASWRMELEERCHTAGVPLQWQQPERVPALLVSPESQQQCQRVLREAVSNALRHAKPSAVSVDIEHQGDALRIVIENDGVPDSPVQHGRGTAIMQQRADELGALLERDHQGPCWRVSLSLSLSLLDASEPPESGGAEPAPAPL